ncbi:hypothetical protein ACIHEI_35900 [Kitasatospora sp. NPDC051984]|uniref:hypothetical protein n=1 Tax=Kitasatospora sp. NPDC051984 TaxID=3364059 RepID=UPI0037CBCAEF
MSVVTEYELKLDWVRIDDVSDNDNVGEVGGSILLDDLTLWQPTVQNFLGGTHSTTADMRAGDFFKLPKERSSHRHFDDDAPQQSVPFRLRMRLVENDTFGQDSIAQVTEEIRPDPNDFNGKASLTAEKTASADGKITYRYTLTRIG